MAANGTKVYNIKINGLDESVKVVDALITKLDDLQARLDKISSMGIKLNSGGGGGGGNVVQELSAEDKLFNSIYNTEVKIEEARNQNYQYLVKIKDELKQVTVEQKAAAAASKLDEKTYDLDTVAGMKEKLKDIKAVLQTTNTGSDLFTQLSKEANELTNKLKLIESQYGQFGRNVGNYTSALGGLSALTVMVGDTEVRFKNATQALREMKRQMDNLRSAGKMNTQEFKNLNEAYKTLQRTSQGLGANMAQMMNAMQSVGAIASIGGGLSTLFGDKNNDVQRSIQRLMALQTVLQGIDTLRKQMQASKGLGSAIAAGSTAVDNFVAKVTGAKVAEEGLTMATNGATKAVRVFSTVLKGVGIGLILAAVGALITAFQKANKEIAEGVSKTDAFNASMDRMSKTLERRLDVLKGDYLRGAIDGEEYLNQELKLQNDYLQENIRLLEEASKPNFWSKVAGRYATRGINVENPFKDAKLTGWGGTTAITTIKQAREEWEKANKEIKKGTGFWDGLFGVSQKNQVAAANVLLSDFVQRIKKIDPAAEDAREQIKALYDEMTDDSIMRDIFANLSKSLPKEEAVKALQAITAELEKMGKAADSAASAMQSRIQQWNIEAITDDIQRQIETENAQYQKDLAEYGQNAEAKEALEKAHQKRMNDIGKQAAQRRLQDANEIQQHLIAAMNDGLAKTLMEIELQRKQAQDQAIQSQRRVEEKLAAINEEYDKKILDAKKDWKEQMIGVYNDMWTEIYQNQIDIESMMAEASGASEETIKNWGVNSRYDVIAGKPYNRGYSADYANTSEWAKELFRGGYDEEILKMASHLKLLREEASLYKDEWDKLNTKKELGVELTKAEIKLMDEYGKAYVRLEGAEDAFMQTEVYTANAERIEEALKHATKVSVDTEAATLKTQFLGVINIFDDYYAARLTATNDYYRKKAEIDKKQAEKDYEFNRQEELRNYEFLMDEYKQQRKVELDGLVQDENYQANRKAVIEKYNDLIDASTDQHQKKLEAMAKSHASQLLLIDQEATDSIREETANRLQAIIQEYENFAGKLASTVANYPITDGSGWGIIDIAATKKRNQEVLEAYETLANRIIAEKDRLQKALSAGTITYDDFRIANEQLNTLQDQIIKTADTAKKNGKNIIGDFISSINTYVQALGSGLQDVLGWLRDKEDAEYNHRKEMLQKQTEELEDALSKQQDITEKYADNVNSIEDELSEARGDRRQQLIDMLNQQKAAQRASLNEEKRIEKEKEAMEAKQEQMELEQKKREHKRQIADAIISSALAVVNALATKPFLPVGLAMGALAAALGAAQVAIIKSTKYASGGMLEGKSHSQGGIKAVVGNRPIELEGNEYVIRKSSTKENLNLLDFINRSEKKLSLSDFIDFYGNGKLKNNLTKNTPKSKFADGGQLPTLRSDISLNNRFISALEAYSERPSYVAVTEIMDRMDDVKNVQAIAGLR